MMHELLTLIVPSEMLVSITVKMVTYYTKGEGVLQQPL